MPRSTPSRNGLSRLPSVRALAEAETLQNERLQFGRDAVVRAARAAIDAARRSVGGETPSGPPDVTAEDVRRELGRQTTSHHRRVINATGVVVHTNLGRSPLAPAARDAIREATGYTNLEMHLATGERGGRDEGIDERVRALTGAEQAFAVNNGAAAALLMLAGTATGREVIVSRGELVEIGGGFRVPDVLVQSGCKLIEVGTTNRTRVSDYERALSPTTGALLKVHPSNFRITGFTEEVGLAELVGVARKAAVPALFDQGSGDLASVRAAIKGGVDLVTCSGDKLLGGPQAGIVLGKAAWVERLRKHPLARALRIDKLTLAGLEATLALWAAGREREIPTVARLNASLPEIRARAEALGRLLETPFELVEASGATGGGARPDEPLASCALRLNGVPPEELARHLRTGDPAVVPRIVDDAVLIDLLTVADEELPELAQAIGRAVSSSY